MKWTNPGYEFDEVAKIICDENNTFYIWGAGDGGRKFLEQFLGKIKIGGIFDSDIKKVGTTLKKIPIMLPENLENKKVIITTSDYYIDIINELENAGLKNNKNYFFKKDFAAIYELYKEDRLVIDWLNISITDRCSLRCKDCIMFSTYFDKPKDQKVEQIKKDVDKCFSLFNYVDVYEILGGEPMMHPNLNEIVTYIGEKYRKSIGNLMVVTNATILPNQEFLNLCRKYNIKIKLSDYAKSKAFCGKQEVKKWIEILDYNGIEKEVFVEGKWHEFGNPQKTYGGIKDEALVELYQKCDCVHSTIRYGKWFSCCRQAAATWSGLDSDNCEDYFDLNIENIDRKILLEFYLKFCSKGWLSRCKGCFGDGIIMVNRVVDAAEQLE